MTKINKEKQTNQGPGRSRGRPATKKIYAPCLGCGVGIIRRPQESLDMMFHSSECFQWYVSRTFKRLEYYEKKYGPIPEGIIEEQNLFLVDPSLAPTHPINLPTSYGYKPSYVYAVEFPSYISENHPDLVFTKVGTSTSLIERLYTLSRRELGNLNLLGVMFGGHKEEYLLHKILKEWLAKGKEWYWLPLDKRQELIEFFESRDPQPTLNMPIWVGRH